MYMYIYSCIVVLLFDNGLAVLVGILKAREIHMYCYFYFCCVFWLFFLVCVFVAVCVWYMYWYACNDDILP